MAWAHKRSAWFAVHFRVEPGPIRLPAMLSVRRVSSNCYAWEMTTPEERFERIEQTLAEMAESRKERQREHDAWYKSHEASLASHASWLLDHERWMQDQEKIVERQDAQMAAHAQWIREMEAVLTAMAAQQTVTSLKLQAFIDSLRKGSNGHKKEEE